MQRNIVVDREMEALYAQKYKEHYQQLEEFCVIWNNVQIPNREIKLKLIYRKFSDKPEYEKQVKEFIAFLMGDLSKRIEVYIDQKSFLTGRVHKPFHVLKIKNR